jgi:hypothetical protein
LAGYLLIFTIKALASPSAMNPNMSVLWLSLNALFPLALFSLLYFPSLINNKKTRNQAFASQMLDSLQFQDLRKRL